MLARIAQELFWLGRNLARAEQMSRLLDGVFQADLQGRPEDPSASRLGWDSLMHIMGASREDDVPSNRDDVLDALTFDSTNPASVVACVARAREGATTVRDVISAEMWEAINTTHLRLRDGDLSSRLYSGPYSIYKHVKERSALFWGLTARTMLRDEASAFLSAGGRIEAGDMVLRMLRVALPSADADVDGAADGQAIALLQAVGGVQAYRRAVPAPAHAGPVARFLLFERNYPDSVAAAVDAVNSALRQADAQPRNSEPILRLSRLSADLEFRRSAEGDADLVRTCREVQRELGLVDADIAQRYFGGARAAA
ncbi:MAG TPA: alpha-E domain-containing protein [Solirubrobacteraceae bacterium]|nr:alpha-E domain-containing protein [Solirubrobacteraceae bacterium]